MPITLYSEPKTLFIIAGERSGDNLAAALIRALRQAGMDESRLRIIGIGGPACEREGLHSLFPMDDLAVMGFQEILPALPRILSRIRRTKQAIRETTPDMLLTVDSPGFSFRIAKAFPKHSPWPDGRIMHMWHYVAPSVWAYKPGRAKKTAALYDRVLALLPFEPPYFEKEGMACDFIGHSAMTHDNAPPPKEPLSSHLHPLEGHKIIAVMPGSRQGEIHRIGPELCGALTMLQQDTTFTPFFLIPAEREDDVRRLLKGYPSLLHHARIITDAHDIHQVRYHADMCLLKSGTVSLEQCLYGSPCLVVYKASAITAAIIRRLIRIPYASLPNLLLDKEVIPELIQEACTPQNIADIVRFFFEHPEDVVYQQQALATVPSLLGARDAKTPAEKAAQRIMECMSAPSPS